ncbi:MAG: hypothetical protein AB8G11_06480 [Saprospiraceae bacterium]
MNRKEVMELVCDISFRTLVREGKSLQTYINNNNIKIIEEAVELIQFLDVQQTVCTPKRMKHNYNQVLHKIFFNS